MCAMCAKVSSDLYFLECEHIVCTMCLEDNIVVANPNDLDLSEVKCPSCSEHIQHTILNEILGAEVVQRVSDEKKSKAANSRLYFLCGICYDNCHMDDAAVLKCGHKFCYVCFEDFISTLMQTRKVRDEDLVCPDCLEPVENFEMQYALRAEVFEKLNLFRMKISLEDQQLPKEVWKFCPDCSFAALIPINAHVFQCLRKGCRRRVCPRCNAEPHLGMDCQSFIRYKESVEEGEKAMQKLIQDEGMKKCPSCGIPTHRESGCNFMTCPSQICRGRKHFCYLCGKALQEEEHFSHYKTTGVFGDSCDTLDGLD